MQELGLMERFADPALFPGLDLGDKIAASLVTTALGMGVTFSILVLLWVAIAVMARVLKAKPAKPAQKANAAPVFQAADSGIQTGDAAATTPELEQHELIAVIMAAIAAAEGKEVVSDLVIRKIDRVSGAATAWRAAGSSDCIESRKL